MHKSVFDFVISIVLYIRAFHHYRGLREHKEALKKHPELDRLLRQEYCSLEDFRTKEKNVKEGSH